MTYRTNPIKGEPMGLEVRKILAKADLKLDEAWKWAKKTLWLSCLFYTAEAVVLLDLVDEAIAEHGQGLEPDEERTRTALRTDIHNLMSQARSTRENSESIEFEDLVEHLMVRNRAHRSAER